MLAGAGVVVRRSGADVSLSRARALDAQSVTVPGDLSSAAFMVAAAVLVGGSRVVVRDVGVNWTRIGFLRILERMGAAVGGELEDVPAPGDPIASAEPICDLDVAAGPLRATTVEAEEVPLAIDELPLVALLGCFAEGETIVRGAAELRVKESDRIAGVVDGLRGLGASIEATEDGFVVTGAGAGCAAARSTRAATTAWRCSARSPAWPRAKASGWSAWRPPRCPIPASCGTSAGCAEGGELRPLTPYVR